MCRLGLVQAGSLLKRNMQQLEPGKQGNTARYMKLPKSMVSCSSFATTSSNFFASILWPNPSMSLYSLPGIEGLIACWKQFPRKPSCALTVSLSHCENPAMCRAAEAGCSTPLPRIAACRSAPMSRGPGQPGRSRRVSRLPARPVSGGWPGCRIKAGTTMVRSGRRAHPNAPTSCDSAAVISRVKPNSRRMGSKSRSCSPA